MNRGTAAEAIQLEQRSVDDPMETDAQLIAKRAKAGNRLVGKIEVTGNAMTRIGALCYVKRRLRHHEQAAERFKSLYEGLYGSGMPAVDAGRIQVDTSVVAHDTGIAGRLDRGKALKDAVDGYHDEYDRFIPGIGKSAADRVIACVVLGVKCEQSAPMMPGGKPNWRRVTQEVDAVLGALDKLAEIWGFAMVGGRDD